MPGIVGPERIVDDRGVIPISTGAVRLRLDIRFDRELGRYVCHEFCAFRDTDDQPASGPVTTETLRRVTLAHWIQFNLLVYDGEESRLIRELENPDGREPWGYTAPDDVTEAGPTDRALRWVAHFYRYGFAVSYNATKSVEESLSLPRSTAGRWVSLARRAGHLEPAGGAGRAGG